MLSHAKAILGEKLYWCFLSWLVVWVYGISTFVGYLVPNPFLYKSVQCKYSFNVKKFHFKQFSFAWVHSLNIKTVIFQVIQFSICMHFRSIWLIDRTLSGTTTWGESEPGSDGNEGVLCIPQSSGITRTSSSDCLVSYPGHSLGESYPSAEKQSVYSTDPTEWASAF